MKSKLPILIASLLLTAALIVGVGGARLAWQPQEVRHPSDRQVLRTLAEEWQQEMNRLDEVLRNDLQDLLEAADPKQEFALREAQAGLRGVAEVTLLPDSTARPQRVRSGTVPAAVPPEVGWQQTPASGPGRMDPKLLLDYDFTAPVASRPVFLRPAQGWLHPSGQLWAFYWARQLGRANSANARVVTLHAPTVIGVIEAHFRQWLPERFSPVVALRGLDFAEGPQHVRLIGGATRPVDRAADFLAPVSSRWGQWQVVSWDRLELKPGWNEATLMATGVIAGLLALMAILVFTQLRRALREAEERVTFVNRVSHDLGTPLTNMMLNLDLAQELLEDAPDQTAERLEVVREEGRRLGRLVQNVLAFSRREQVTQPLRAESCQPSEIIHAVLRQFEPSLKRWGVHSEVMVGPMEPMLLDPDALAQILANLISNVEKYAAAGGRLEINAEAGAGELIITVQDAGPGIAAADRERIFAPFCRLSNRVNEGASGTGLGLAIARDLARQMGGDLTCLQSRQVGATFRLRLPLISEPHPPAPQPL